MKKKFDCVQMKWEIQQKLRKEYEGLTLEERNRLAEQKINNDPILGPWWRKVKEHQANKARIAAEAQAEYRVALKAGRKHKHD